MINTSININSKIKNKIEIIAEKLKVHQNEIIKKALNKFALENKQCKINSAVRYQVSDKISELKQFHIVFTNSEYEVFTDLRNFCKLSVSLILAIMIEKLYNENEVTNLMNNYSQFDYFISFSETLSVKKWIIEWKT